MLSQSRKHFFTFNIPMANHRTEFDSKKRQFKLAKQIALALALITVTIQLPLALPANSKVIRQDQVDIADKHYPYLYQWSDSAIKPKAIVIAIHGVTMHGLTYDHLAYHLAQEGTLVLSPDLPGCGRRWQKDSVSYIKAQEELIDIIQSVKKTHKNLPIICLGESLGANLALSTAETNPQLVDGIVLSSPALKRRINVTPKTVVGSVNMLVGLVKTNTLVDLSPYVRAYASEDPTIVQTMLDDPLIHRQIKSQDLWDSCNAMKSVFKEAKLISKTTPVLIIQGSQDRILKANAIIKLVSNLNSDDQTVKWLNHQGHMILEECQPRADVLQTIDDWFKTHVDKSVAEVKTNNMLPITSVLPPLPQAPLNTRTN
jgi:alpha-beta hydrolase superfamily lysophospholipase